MCPDFERNMDPELLWGRARDIVEEKGDKAAANVEDQIAKHERNEDAEQLMIWKALRWRVAELARRLRFDAIKDNLFGF